MQKKIEHKNLTLPSRKRKAPGSPGESPCWSSGAKTAVGGSVSLNSRIWFTIAQGVITELYHPDVDQANTRSVRFVVTDGEPGGYFSDEEFDADHRAEAAADGVPAFSLTCTCPHGNYRIHKQVFSDPVRDGLFVQVRFEPMGPDADKLRLFLLVDPQMGDKGGGNTGWAGNYMGAPMLLACKNDLALAAVASVPFTSSAVGFAGRSDGLTQLKKYGTLRNEYNWAPDGNVRLCGEIDFRSAPNGEFTTYIAFGSTAAEAGQQARAGILENLEQCRNQYVHEWRERLDTMMPLPVPEGGGGDLYRTSAMVLHVHESKRFRGAFVASLAIPWGFDRGDEDIAGYHALWPRDCMEIAMGRVACGDYTAARRALFYMNCVQKADGSWSQNMWLDGTEHLGAQQMDGIAMPVLLAAALDNAGELDTFDPWPMVSKATGFLLKNGPHTEQGRWEAIGGYAIFSMACEVAALVTAAVFAERDEAAPCAEFLRETADAWNAAIDDYCYAEGTALAREHGVDGYYIRVAPASVIENKPLAKLNITMPNHIPGNRSRRAVDIVSPDALALVRFGLRRADDPRMLATVKVIDATLKHDLATGPGWRRSSHDGYGERAGGEPFEKWGIGRCWPLLAGERAHYELALGHRDEAIRLLRTMSEQTSECGMIPEQVWDAEDLPARQLLNGHPTGSGMPLAWAHAEYIKLLRSLKEHKIWIMPTIVSERYARGETRSDLQIWTERAPRQWITAGKRLRLDCNDPAEARCVLPHDRTHVLTGRSGEPNLHIHSVYLDTRAAKRGDMLKIELTTGDKMRTLNITVR